MISYATFRQDAHIVNRMMTMKSSSSLCLPDLITKLPAHAYYSRARPCRIYWRFQDRIPVQIFPKGTIQILGRYASTSVCNEIRDYFSTHLSLSLSHPYLNSCTVSARIAPRICRLHSLPSNQYVSNEYELFPGTMIRRHHRRRRIHLCFFSNGTVIATGVHSRREAYRQIKHCIQTYDLIH